MQETYSNMKCRYKRLCHMMISTSERWLNRAGVRLSKPRLLNLLPRHLIPMEKKRPAESEPETRQPATKHFRSNSDAETQPIQDNQASFNDAPPEDPVDADEERLLTFQRSQLAAKISEQNRDNAWLRDKVDELQKLVAVLDAAPRAALYHMCAVREDLTLTLARAGVSVELDPRESPVAAVMLNAEEVTNESLGEMPQAIQKLTAQLILSIEAKQVPTEAEVEMRKANEDLHRRLRQTSDQLERFAAREKESLVSSTTFRDEYDDLRSESSLQRKRIVALELRMKEREEAFNKRLLEEARNVEDAANASNADCSKDHNDPVGNSVLTQNGDLHAFEAAKELSESRLQELNILQESHRQALTELEGLRAELEKRDSNVVPIKSILNAGLYQTMEATLQQLCLKERNWHLEREALKEDLRTQQTNAEEELHATKSAAEKSIEDLRKHMDELRRVADAAKVEKDKVVMTYEVRKMEAGNAAAVIEAAEKRASTCERMREKLSVANKELTTEVEKLQARLKEIEAQLGDSAESNLKPLLDGLRKDLEEERAKSAGFIEEVENLSNMFAELESENEKLVKHLSEKEQVLSKVMAERLRGRQLLTTVKEENKVLSQGRDIDADKLKSETNALNASRRAAQEATMASLKLQQETRELSTALEKRRRIADDATVASRSAAAERDEMKRERDIYMARVEKISTEASDDRFKAKRLHEKLTVLERRAKEAEDALQKDGGGGGTDENVKDALILELRKKLNCSVVTTESKAVVLLRCGHLFSRQCTDNLIATRNRKCPMCGKAFGNDDVRPVFF